MNAESPLAVADGAGDEEESGASEAAGASEVQAKENGASLGSEDGDEEILAHLSGWFRRRPNALEFWEFVVTDRRLYRCRVGESFRSLLLRADVGGRGRDRVESAVPGELLGLNDANTAVPLSALRRLDLREGSLLRRGSLTLTWADERGDETTWDLYGTATSDDGADVVGTLARDARLDHVDVTVDTGGRLF